MKKRASLALGIFMSANLLPLTTIADTQTITSEDREPTTEHTENISGDLAGKENILESTGEASDTVEVSESMDELSEVGEADSELEEKTIEQATTDQQEGTTENSRAVNPISDTSFNLTTDAEEFHNYSTSSYAILGLSGTFTLDESQVTNGETVKISDVSVSANIPGLEGVVSNNTSTTIKNESGEILGTLSLEGTALVLKISADYTLKDNQEKFTFNNTTALKFTPTQDMVKANVDVVETVKIGDSSVSITFYEQETYDLTTLTRDAVDLQLSSGTSGYASSRIYDIAYNQAGLTELQASNGASASSENLKTGDYKIASTLSSNVIPTGGTIFLATYIASENNSKLQTNNTSGLASLPATSHEKTVSLPLKTLPEGMDLNQLNSLIEAGIDATYASKQSDGTYLVVQNISEATLTISEELLRDTTNASTTSSDPSGAATVEYYGKALNNRATQATSWVNFEYVDPSISNTVTTDLLDNVTGNVINSASKDSKPQEVIVEGQSTIKEHYVDENGNPLDNVTINHGWPTSDVSHGGAQYSSSAKDFDGYALNIQANSIPGVTLSNGDKIATTSTSKVDYPKAGSITNIYYVYTKNPVAGSNVTAKYIDTEENKISDDVVKSGNIGEDYTTEQKEIEGYTFKEVQGDTSGKFTDQAQTVTYVYTKNPVVVSNVTAKYVDTEGNKISDDVVKSGNIGEDYTTEQKEIDGYTFKEVQGDISGKFTDQAQMVTYVYTKNPVAGSDVTAKYVDTEGNKISDDVVKSGNIGEDYTTEQKEIDGYTFKEVQGDTSGKFTEQSQIVFYIYEKNDETVPEEETEQQTSNSPFVSQRNDISNSDSKYLPTTGEKAAFGLSLVGLSSLVLAGYYYFRNKK
ncbi:MucBP domain-containing protein [Lactococcus garvieae]|uniref:MucBP domain-containing protein n=1 Tax=Lactococcus garvieae TaxID=1363 RepID=UPI0038523EAA